MKYLFFFILFFKLTLFSSDTININFKNLKIQELIKITSEYLNKNILYSNNLNIKVGFVSSSPIKKDDLYIILKSSLEQNGFMLKEDNGILKVIKKENFYEKRDLEIIKIKNLDVNNILVSIKKIIENNKFFKSELKPVVSHIKESNSLIIAGVKEDINFIKEFIKKVDVLKSQIYVKAKILEISETKTNNIGLEYGLQGFSKYSNTTLSSFSSSLNSISNNSVNLSSFASYGFDITSLSKAISLGATINLLKQNEAVDVISEPSILCVNNIESSIYVGETKSFKTGQTTNENGTSESFKREDIGLKLLVKPRITDNKIALHINTILEDAKESTNSENLDTSKKEVKTNVVLNNGESVIIGGLIKSKNFNVESKVPLLGDIPIFGNLFKNEKYINDKINLIVIITPYIISKELSLTEIKSKLDDLSFIENKYMNSLIEKLEEKDKEKAKTNKQSHEEVMKEYFGYKY